MQGSKEGSGLLRGFKAGGQSIFPRGRGDDIGKGVIGRSQEIHVAPRYAKNVIPGGFVVTQAQRYIEHQFLRKRFGGDIHRASGKIARLVRGEGLGGHDFIQQVGWYDIQLNGLLSPDRCWEEPRRSSECWNSGRPIRE